MIPCSLEGMYQGFAEHFTSTDYTVSNRNMNLLFAKISHFIFYKYLIITFSSSILFSKNSFLSTELDLKRHGRMQVCVCLTALTPCTFNKLLQIVLNTWGIYLLSLAKLNRIIRWWHMRGIRKCLLWKPFTLLVVLVLLSRGSIMESVEGRKGGASLLTEGTVGAAREPIERRVHS
jgi:hypothetical protein